MALVESIRQLSQRKLLVSLVLLLALAAAILSAYRVTANPLGLHKRELSVAAASSQILVDSPNSTLVAGADLGTFDALATRAKIYGQYLSSLAAREEIADAVGVPARTIATSGPFSPATGQSGYESQTSEDRANELLKEGAQNRLVFTAQEGVPILTVSAQAPSTEEAIALATASFATLKRYVHSLQVDGKPIRRGVTVRQLGAPEGGTLGGSNNVILMALAFLVVFTLGCAAILVIPGFVDQWRALDSLDHAAAATGRGQAPPNPNGDFDSSHQPGDPPEESIAAPVTQLR
jgi:hypothetical protein